MSKEDLLLLDFWVSPFCMRVKIAFAEKGLTYISQEEDLLGGKSELLLKSNPIYQKVPVLLDNGKPIVESSNIVYYIDEKYANQNPLLPSCAYGRSRARFWADCIDKKVYEGGMAIWRSTKADELELGKKEFVDILKKLEGALGDKDYFGGDNFGYIDDIAISMTCWFHAYEKFGGFKVDEECPKFDAWINRCLKRESVASVLPDPEKVYDFVVMLRKMHGIE
ncbi:glutathione S-transferase U19-like [Lycium barbarum]|uniref:glutathione S-transferase U19-like n=1 Tax=Lycium barbarum TaxID=112863 RepID=UPI00293F5B65|nr:glutathione S-transferase U19-like [Lycium barbarum]